MRSKQTYCCCRQSLRSKHKSELIYLLIRTCSRLRDSPGCATLAPTDVYMLAIPNPARAWRTPGGVCSRSWSFCAELVHIGPQVLLRCLQRIPILLILSNPMGDPFRTPDQTCSSSVPEVDVIRDASCCSAYVIPHCSKGSDTHLFRCNAANGRKKLSPPRAVQHRTN